MAMNCHYCNKKTAHGNNVSHSHIRTKRTWKPNIQRVRAIVDGTPRRVYVCSRCLRSGKVQRNV
ncbi:MAG: 50S ribosomal protein L28 [Clostridiales bacterium]|nr:50S ribosomal protein L28 [Clostridiales bacterium]